jgi:hypothetical protein
MSKHQKQPLPLYRKIVGPVLSLESQARQYACRAEPGIHRSAITGLAS